jgi:hypothetical protein
MKKADKERYEKLAELGCIVCKLFEDEWSPIDVHHINGRTGNGNQETLGLCFYHHREGSNCESHVSRHPWLTEFEQRYKTEAELLEITNDLIK